MGCNQKSCLIVLENKGEIRQLVLQASKLTFIVSAPAGGPNLADITGKLAWAQIGIFDQLKLYTNKKIQNYRGYIVMS